MKGLYKDSFKKIMAIAASMGLVFTDVTVIGQTSVMAGSNETESSTESDAESSTESDAENSVKSGKAEKDETVYVFTDASGNEKSMVVSNWLKNLDKATEIRDYTSLANIVNVKGDETYSEDGSDLIWHADGNDIYYQGDTAQQAPVSVHITYYLDGQEIAPADLAGKSGHLKIVYDYTNNEKKKALVNHKLEDVYVPFAVMSGMVFSDGVMENATVSVGKVITEGSNTIVVGLAFPGLKDSLKLDSMKDLDIDADSLSNSVEVEGDVKDFEMNLSMSVVLDDMLDDVLDETDDDSSLQDLRDDMDDLQDAADELMDGSQKLADGVGELNDKVPDLKDGIADLDDGVNEYTDGVGEAFDGVKELKKGTGQLNDGSLSLQVGAAKLARGTGKLNDKVPDLVDGVEQLDDGAQKLADGAGDLKDGIDSAKDGSKQLKDGAG